jgi:hypothetical protein
MASMACAAQETFSSFNLSWSDRSTRCPSSSGTEPVLYHSPHLVRLWPAASRRAWGRDG